MQKASAPAIADNLKGQTRDGKRHCVAERERGGEFPVISRFRPSPPQQQLAKSTPAGAAVDIYDLAIDERRMVRT